MLAQRETAGSTADATGATTCSGDFVVAADELPFAAAPSANIHAVWTIVVTPIALDHTTLRQPMLQTFP